MKQYTADRLENIIMRVVVPYSKSVSTVIDPGPPPLEKTEKEYYAGCIKSQAIPAGDGTFKKAYNEAIIGLKKKVPWTEKEIYTELNKQWPLLAQRYKQLEIDGIDVDPSK